MRQLKYTKIPFRYLIKVVMTFHKLKSRKILLNLISVICTMWILIDSTSIWHVLKFSHDYGHHRIWGKRDFLCWTQELTSLRFLFMYKYHNFKIRKRTKQYNILKHRYHRLFLPVLKKSRKVTVYFGNLRNAFCP